MKTENLSIRTQSLEDIPLIVDYFLNAGDEFLLKMAWIGQNYMTEENG